MHVIYYEQDSGNGQILGRPFRLKSAAVAQARIAAGGFGPLRFAKYVAVWPLDRARELVASGQPAPVQ